MRGGFSLLEVMVAIAILGLSLTVILSAQGGLAASNRSAANMGQAVQLGRCKMTEVEEQLLKLGYQEIDQVDEGVPCCVDATPEAFTCNVKIEKIELPNMTPGSSSSDGGVLGASSSLLQQNAAGGPGLDLSLDGGLQGLGSALSGQIPGAGPGGAGAEGLLGMVMGFLYPSIKPMYEASIRRVTVTVRWKEGPNQRELPITQFVTNPQRGRRTRGMTLLEILVSLGIMSMISLMIYGAFDSLSRGRRGEALRSDRARQGRDAVERIAHELQSAFLSMHTPSNQALITRQTGFYAQNSSQYDRVDFTSFAHRRVTKDARESDQAEIGFFVVKDPDVDGKMDLVRREQAPIDYEFKKGGIVNVIAEDVERFDLRYLDPITGQWVDTWDTTQVTGQFNRLPLEIRIDLELKPVRNTPPFRYVTKIMMPMQQPLQFGIMQ